MDRMIGRYKVLECNNEGLYPVIDWITGMTHMLSSADLQRLQDQANRKANNVVVSERWI